jgi:hypothetical protein
MDKTDIVFIYIFLITMTIYSIINSLLFLGIIIKKIKNFDINIIPIQQSKYGIYDGATERDKILFVTDAPRINNCPAFNVSPQEMEEHLKECRTFLVEKLGIPVK